MTAEHAWNVLRTAAGVEFGALGYFSPRTLLNRAVAGMHTADEPRISTAAKTLGLI